MRTRLRRMPTRQQLRRLYAVPHDHRKWFDHRIRVDVTIAIAEPHTPKTGVIADLSCGNAEIPRRLAQSSLAHQVYLGDYAPGYDLTGPIEQTIEQIEPDSVDMWVCSETIEHLDDPDAVLAQIRKRADKIILSTPDGETLRDNNPEHVWSWDSEAVEKMLVNAGFNPLIHNVLDLRPAGFVYAYQIWLCERS
jgi:hypothetical protein